MSRAQILEDTIARLEAERYAPLPPRRLSGEPMDLLPELTPQMVAENNRWLREFTGDDTYLRALADGKAS